MTFDGIKDEQMKKIEFKKKYQKFHDIEKQIIDQFVDKYTNKFV